jgi:hypothetical protein
MSKKRYRLDELTELHISVCRRVSRNAHLSVEMGPRLPSGDAGSRGEPLTAVEGGLHGKATARKANPSRLRNLCTPGPARRSRWPGWSSP